MIAEHPPLYTPYISIYTYNRRFTECNTTFRLTHTHLLVVNVPIEIDIGVGDKGGD